MCVVRFVKRNIVFCTAMFAAFVTCLLVPPDKGYLDYFDWNDYYIDFYYELYLILYYFYSFI